MLADLASLERRVVPLRRSAAGGDKEAKAEVALMDAALAVLGEGKPARLAEVHEGRGGGLPRGLNLLTAKPVLYVANVEEAAAATGNRHSEAGRGDGQGARAPAPSSSRRRSRRRSPSFPTRRSTSSSLPSALSEPGLDRLIRAGYELLGLITYLHRRAEGGARLDDPQGTSAPQAAGVIHTDFEKGFIRAQTIAYDDFIAPRRRTGGQGSRQGPRRRQGIRRRGRRRDAVQVQRLRPAAPDDFCTFPRLCRRILNFVAVSGVFTVERTTMNLLSTSNQNGAPSMTPKAMMNHPIEYLRDSADAKPVHRGEQLRLAFPFRVCPSCGFHPRLCLALAAFSGLPAAHRIVSVCGPAPSRSSLSARQR